jgi:thiamine-phosphate pyrophosphorylase
MTNYNKGIRTVGNVSKETMELYLVTDSTGLEEEVFLQKVEAALQGGVTILQLREKEKSTREYMELATKVHAITKKYGVPLIIDDRVDVALAIDAEGVHVGQSDMPVDIARKLMGPEKIVGATTKTVEQAKKAYEKGADYLGVGAIYPTTTKVKTVLTSVDTLRDICNAVPIPANAIGGLNKDNIHVLKGVPIAGICVVSAIMKAEDSGVATKELLDRWRYEKSTDHSR